MRKGGGRILFSVSPSFFSLPVLGVSMGEGSEIQISDNTENDVSGGVPQNPVEPLYFMAGFIAGLIFISLFKGRWFL